MLQVACQKCVSARPWRVPLDFETAGLLNEDVIQMVKKNKTVKSLHSYFLYLFPCCMYKQRSIGNIPSPTETTFCGEVKVASKTRRVNTLGGIFRSTIYTMKSTASTPVTPIHYSKKRQHHTDSPACMCECPRKNNHCRQSQT